MLILTVIFSSCAVRKPQVSATPTYTPSTAPAVSGEQGVRSSVAMTADEKLLFDEAMSWIGTPYRFGGEDYDGTDCSGLTMKVYKKALGIALPRSSREQQQFCSGVRRGNAAVGDLVFFATGRDKTRVSHVGLYIGDGRFVHASGSKGVIVSHIDERYYSSNYHSTGHVARRGERRHQQMTEPQGGKEQIPDNYQQPRKRKPVEPGARKQTPPQPLETEPIRIGIDEIIESKIDSIYTAFLE